MSKNITYKVNPISEAIEVRINTSFSPIRLIGWSSENALRKYKDEQSAGMWKKKK